jgi:hypothetical protein
MPAEISYASEKASGATLHKSGREIKKVAGSLE